jgi:hypothetical protein
MKYSAEAEAMEVDGLDMVGSNGVRGKPKSGRVWKRVEAKRFIFFHFVSIDCDFRSAGIRR